MATFLQIDQIKVRNLRCHDNVQWRCKSGLNLLIGENGSGKTTLLEAIYLMSHSRSFRQARDPNLIRRGQLCFNVEGQWHRYGPLRVLVKGSRGKTETVLQGRKIRQRRDLAKCIPVLVEAPQGQRLVDGVPNERRRWLNTLLTDCHDRLMADFKHYGRAMMQRSRLLRRGSSHAEIDVWEQQIVIHGQRIVLARDETLNQLNAELALETALTEGPVNIEVQKVEYEYDRWLSRLKESRDQDQRTGRLSFGPHTDRIGILYQGREIRSSGSRGQQKLASVSLKLAECAVRRHHRQIVPILLLDDCIEALDPQRQERLIRRLGQFSGQILMTAPANVHIPSGVDVYVQSLTNDGICPVDQSERESRFNVGEAA